MRFFLITSLLCLTFSNVAFSWQTMERECKCILNNLWLDVYLLIDDSTKMGSAGLFEVASNVNSVFGYSQIRVGNHYPDMKGTRVSIVTYNQAATIRANLSDFSSTDQLTSMVYSLKPSDSSESNLQEGLKKLEEMINYKDENCPRNNTRTVAVIYAGDYHDYDGPTIAQIGYRLQQNGLIIVTVADISRNDHLQIEHLKALANEGDGFNINDDYVSEEVQQAMCRANCFCPHQYHQFVTSENGTTSAHGTCVRYTNQLMNWNNAKFFCQNIHKQAYMVTEYSQEKHLFNQDFFESIATQIEPMKYHIGLHFVNNGYFWEQPNGLPLIPLSSPLYPIDTKPASTLQCISNIENVDTKEMKWQNENCFNELKGVMCEIPACDTENYCS